MADCIFCGKQLNNSDKCVWCGFSQKERESIPGTLSYGTKLGNYVTGNIFSVDGESTAYFAFDTVSQKTVLVKEFLPVTLVAPRNNNDITVQPDKQVLFKNLLMDFIDLYQTLQKITHPAMPKIYDVFGANKTAYVVMEYVNGTPLSQVLIKRGKPFTFKEVRWLLENVFSLLNEFSKLNIHHGGLSDETIMITADNTVMVTGFAIQDLRTKNEHIAYKLYDGFSAPEQYYSDRFQGMYTDIYAIASLIYYSVTGKKFTAQELNNKDIYRLFPKYAVEALRYATAENPKERLDSITDFVLMLDDKGVVVKPPQNKEGDDRKKQLQYAAIGTVFIVILLVAFMAIKPEPAPSSSEEISSSESQSVAAELLPNFVGKRYADVIADSNYQKNYTFVKLEAYSEEYGQGYICKQSPEKDEEIEAGQTVYLTVSLGPRTVRVPLGLKGISYEDAIKKLDALNIQYRKEYIDQTREYVSGMVADLSIGEGEEISIKEDVLIVYVANDKPFATPTPSPTPTPAPTPTPSPTPESSPESDAEEEAESGGEITE